VKALVVAAALAAPAQATEVIGQSVEHRPIVVTRVGDPAAPRKVLVVGEVHGDETAGRGIVDALRKATPPPGSQLLLIEDLNPDGFAHGTRTNAHGVDLNRNSSEHWAGAGPKPWSEPEARAVRSLILRERPALTIYYHQPYGLVDVPEGGRPQMARRYARLTGLPLVHLRRRPGSLSRWQNVRIRQGSAIVVELAAGTLRRATRRRHVAAVLALATPSPARARAARAARGAAAPAGTSSSRPAASSPPGRAPRARSSRRAGSPLTTPDRTPGARRSCRR
jgi:murein peptide amidase A